MLLTFILLYLNIWSWHKGREEKPDRLFCHIQASTVWTLLLFLITEVYSVFHLIGFLPLVLTWYGLAAVLLLMLLLRRKQTKQGKKSRGKAAGPRVPEEKPDLRVLFIGAVSLFVLVMAMTTVPYNWDSMTYHLPRIMHWAQNGSVAHYSTNVLRQISSPVLAEFVNLHVYLLTGGRDILFHLLQGLSFLTCAACVYGIAGKLKCTLSFRFLATLLYMSMPIAFAEALTTQVDNFATVWLLYFVYLLLDFTDLEKKLVADKTTVVRVCLLGLFVSFGYLTKPSVCIAMAIMVLWLLAVCMTRKDSVKILVKLIACVLPAILLPLLPELMRNLKTFSAIASQGTGQRQLVGTLNPLYLFVNFLKNFVYNLPNVYLNDSGYFLTRLVKKVAGILGVELDAPSIAEDGREFFLHTAPDYAHDTAINPVIVILMLVCIVLWIRKLKKKELGKTLKKSLMSYSFVAVVCFLVFCVLLRWEPFVTRYMVSYLALLCPMIAVQLQKHTAGGERTVMLGIISFVCIMEIGSMALYHRNMCTRFGAGERPYGYFTNRIQDYPAYSQICQYVIDKGFSNIGLYMGEDNYEYPLWYSLRDTVRRMEHVYVTNESAVYDDPSFLPEGIIWIGPLPGEAVAWHGQEYGEAAEFGEDVYFLAAY